MATDIQIVKETVTAKTRKLKASWTIEETYFPKFKVISEQTVDDVRWYKIEIYDMRVTNWVHSQSFKLWIRDDNSFAWWLSDSLYTLFLLKWSE